jgi:hypothetical protein
MGYALSGTLAYAYHAEFAAPNTTCAVLAKLCMADDHDKHGCTSCLYQGQCDSVTPVAKTLLRHAALAVHGAYACSPARPGTCVTRAANELNSGWNCSIVVTLLNTSPAAAAAAAAAAEGGQRQEAAAAQLRWTACCCRKGPVTDVTRQTASMSCPGM